MPGLFDQYFASKRLLARYLAQIGHGILSLPQRATEAAGSLQYGGSCDPGPALETAGLVALGSFPLRGAAAAESVASKSAGSYNPPAKPPRPFAADYPSGVPADASGRLIADIEGRPLTGRYVVGRRLVGGNDQALPPAEFDALTAATTGRSAQTAPASALGHDVGRVSLAPYTKAPQEVYLSRRLTRQQAERVYAHELGHVIAELAGGIPTASLNTELRQVYNTLNTGMERTRHLTGPQHLGYKAEDVPKELMAEALRAYLADPNYLKTVAPKTAAAIRAAVNSHPTLRKIIQFNAIASPVAMGAIDPEPGRMASSE
jgi:hypothetical protein